MTYPYYVIPVVLGAVLCAAVVAVLALSGVGVLATLATIYLAGVGVLFLTFGLLDVYDSTWGRRAGSSGVGR